ncbi:hypothetical protein [Paenibacillus sp. HB172176]|uniref:hypothetical protein n=1 Tax=Paenibacillus sp. HB172176 TaxID=2493690 RepID=UPI00197F44DF|nr:hypothetical protein [Paenibacillus sp. HB172176]
MMLMKELQINNLNYVHHVSLFNHYRILDTITGFSASLTAGSINGLVGEMGSGGWLVSYLLAGRINDLTESSAILLNGQVIGNQTLRDISCYVGEGVIESPYRKLKNYPGRLKRKILNVKTVADQIKLGILKTNNTMTLEKISELFDLSGLNEKNERNGRIYRPLEFQSGEVWRASMAIGVAYQKKLFCFPWLEPHYLKYILAGVNLEYIKMLKEMGCMLLIPISDDNYLKDISTQNLYLKKRKIIL